MEKSKASTEDNTNIIEVTSKDDSVQIKYAKVWLNQPRGILKLASLPAAVAPGRGHDLAPDGSLSRSGEGDLPLIPGVATSFVPELLQSNCVWNRFVHFRVSMATTLTNFKKKIQFI